MLVDYGAADVYVTILPAILSVLSVNLVIILYILAAFKQHKLEKQD